MIRAPEASPGRPKKNARQVAHSLQFLLEGKSARERGDDSFFTFGKRVD